MAQEKEISRIAPTDNDLAALEEKARSGDTEAAQAVALIYELGLEAPQDEKKADEFWRQAAEAGSGWAAYNVANRLRTGKGVKRDREAADTWLPQSRQSGFDPDTATVGKVAHQSAAVLQPRVLVLTGTPQTKRTPQQVMMGAFATTVAANVDSASRFIEKNSDLGLVSHCRPGKCP